MILFWGGKNHTTLFVSPAREGWKPGIWTSRAPHLCRRSRFLWMSACVCVCLRLGTGNKCASVKIDNKVLQRSCQDRRGGWGRKAERVGESWSQEAMPKRLAQVLCRGEGEESSCSFSRGVYGSEGACVPVKSTHQSAQHMSPQITVSLPPPSPHSLLNEGRAERSSEKRRRFNRCLGAQCTFSRIHCLSL